MATNETALTVFQFNPETSIRIIRDQQGKPWFVASDICKLLEYSNVAQTVGDHVDEDDRGYILLSSRADIPSISSRYSPGSVLIVNESGMYALILGSKKPEAKAFKKWVTSDVLPTLYNTGQYSTRTLTPLQILKQQVELMENLEREQAEQRRQIAAVATRVERLEDTFDADRGGPRMMTVRAYATHHGLRLSDNELVSKGKAAKVYSDQHGYPIEHSAHRIYGNVNLYHVDVLKVVFSQRRFFDRADQG